MTLNADKKKKFMTLKDLFTWPDLRIANKFSSFHYVAMLQDTQ